MGKATSSERSSRCASGCDSSGNVRSASGGIYVQALSRSHRCFTAALTIEPAAVASGISDDNSISHTTPSCASVKTAPWVTLAAAEASTSSSAALVVQKPRVLPSVVSQHAERVAQSRAASKSVKKHFGAAALNGIESNAAQTTLRNEEVELTSPSRMTRQQKRAARAFTSLHSPVAGKSLGDANLAHTHHCDSNTTSSGSDSIERRGSSTAQDSRPETTDQSLFLFPTMTRQRQLHGKYVECLFITIF